MEFKGGLYCPKYNPPDLLKGIKMKKIYLLNVYFEIEAMDDIEARKKATNVVETIDAELMFESISKISLKDISIPDKEPRVIPLNPWLD